MLRSRPQKTRPFLGLVPVAWGVSGMWIDSHLEAYREASRPDLFDPPATPAPASEGV